MALLALSGALCAIAWEVRVSPSEFDEDGIVAPSAVEVFVNVSDVASVPRNESCYVGLVPSTSLPSNPWLSARWAPCTLDADFVASGVVRLRTVPSNLLGNYSVAVFPLGGERGLLAGRHGAGCVASRSRLSTAALAPSSGAHVGCLAEHV